MAEWMGSNLTAAPQLLNLDLGHREHREQDQDLELNLEQRLLDREAWHWCLRRGEEMPT